MSSYLLILEVCHF